MLVTGDNGGLSRDDAAVISRWGSWNTAGSGLPVELDSSASARDAELSYAVDETDVLEEPRSEAFRERMAAAGRSGGRSAVVDVGAESAAFVLRLALVPIFGSLILLDIPAGPAIDPSIVGRGSSASPARSMTFRNGDPATDELGVEVPLRWGAWPAPAVRLLRKNDGVLTARDPPALAACLSRELMAGLLASILTPTPEFGPNRTGTLGVGFDAPDRVITTGAEYVCSTVEVAEMTGGAVCAATMLGRRTGPCGREGPPAPGERRLGAMLPRELLESLIILNDANDGRRSSIAGVGSGKCSSPESRLDDDTLVIVSVLSTRVRPVRLLLESPRGRLKIESRRDPLTLLVTLLPRSRTVVRTGTISRCSSSSSGMKDVGCVCFSYDVPRDNTGSTGLGFPAGIGETLRRTERRGEPRDISSRTETFSDCGLGRGRRLLNVLGDADETFDVGSLDGDTRRFDGGWECDGRDAW